MPQLNPYAHVFFGNWKKNKNLDRKISKNRDFKMKREWDWIDLKWNEMELDWILGKGRVIFRRGGFKVVFMELI